MKTETNFKVVVKLAIWHLLFVGLVLLVSCSSEHSLETDRQQECAFVPKPPEFRFKDSSKPAGSADSALASHWDKNCSRWYGYSSFGTDSK